MADGDEGIAQKRQSHRSDQIVPRFDQYGSLSILVAVACPFVVVPVGVAMAHVVSRGLVGATMLLFTGLFCVLAILLGLVAGRSERGLQVRYGRYGMLLGVFTFLVAVWGYLQ